MPTRSTSVSAIAAANSPFVQCHAARAPSPRRTVCPRTSSGRVSEHHGDRRFGPLLPREPLPESGLRAHEAKQVRGDEGRGQEGRGLHVVADVHAGVEVRRHPAESACAVLPVIEVRERYAGFPPGRVAGAQEDDSPVVDRQSAEQHGVHEREHGGRRPDGQREDERRPEGVPPVLHQQPGREPQAPLQFVGEPQASREPGCILHALDAAEVRPGAAVRFRRRHASPHQVLRVDGEVKAHLLVERVLEAFPPDQRRQERAQAREQRHAASVVEPRAVLGTTRHLASLVALVPAAGTPARGLRATRRSTRWSGVLDSAGVPWAGRRNRRPPGNSRETTSS